MGASCAVNTGCAIQDDSLPEYGGARPVSPIEDAETYNIHNRTCKIQFEHNKRDSKNNAHNKLLSGNANDTQKQSYSGNRPNNDNDNDNNSNNNPNHNPNIKHSKTNGR